MAEETNNGADAAADAAAGAKAEVKHIEGGKFHTEIKSRIKGLLDTPPSDFGAVTKEKAEAVLKAFDEHAEVLVKANGDKKFTSEQLDALAEEYFKTHVKNAMAAEGEDIKSALGAGIKQLEEAKGVEVKAAAAEAAKEAGKAGFFARNFSKDVKANWKGSSTGIKFARGTGTALGVALVGMGGKDIVSKDEDGNRHVVSGIVKTGVGAAAIAASLMAKNKGASASV